MSFVVACMRSGSYFYMLTALHASFIMDLKIQISKTTCCLYWYLEMFWRSFFLPSAEYKKSNFLEVDGLGYEDGGSKIRETSVTSYKSTQCHVRKGLNVGYIFFAQSELGTSVPLLTDFRRVCKIAKSNDLSRLPAPLPEWNSASTGRIFVKFDI